MDVRTPSSRQGMPASLRAGLLLPWIIGGLAVLLFGGGETYGRWPCVSLITSAVLFVGMIILAAISEKYGVLGVSQRTRAYFAWGTLYSCGPPVFFCIVLALAYAGRR